MCFLSPFVVAWSGAVGSLLPVRLPVVAPVPSSSLVTLCFLLFCPSVQSGFLYGVGGSGVGGVCSYLNGDYLALSSHCGLCTLILCAGTLDPRIHWWVARTKVMVILLLTYPHVFE